MTKKKKIISSLCVVATTVILGTSIFFGSAALLKINFSDLFYNANKDKTSQKNDVKEEDYEFIFNGSTTIANQNYNVNLYGIKDKNQSISLKIKELPIAELTGNWKFVKNKGYKIYFDDANGSFAYTKYNVETKNFTFNYTLNIGDTNGGSGKVNFSYKDIDFFNEYDGEGLGNVPPTFFGYTTYIGAMFALGEPMQCVLTCYEDGSCVSLSTNEVKFASERKGTWEFNSNENKYTFNFENEPFKVNKEEGSTYWKFTKEVGKCSLEEASKNWTFMGGGTCYWEQTKITQELSNTFSTVYNEENNTYFLLYEHGISGFSEFADRYVSWSPDNI